MIRFACPGCNSTFSVDDSKAGKSGKCPKCQAQFIIPQLEAVPAEATPPVPAPAPLPVPVPVPVSVQVQQPAADPNAPVEIDPCPKCQTKLSVTVGDLGNDVECPYCKTVFKSQRAGTRPPAPPAPPGGKKSSFETDFSSRPKSKRRDDDEDDDRPRKRRRDDDDDDDRPSKRRREDDDDDDRPSRRGRASSRRDDEDDDRPSKRRRGRRDDDEDDDYEDRPRRRSRSRRRSGGSGQRSGAVTAVGILTIIIGVLWLLAAGAVFFGSAYLMTLIGVIPRGGGGFGGGVDPQAREAAETGIMGAALCCGLPLLLLALLHLMGGIFTVQRKTVGRILVIICAAIALISGLFGLYGLFRLLMVRGMPFEPILYNLLSTGLTLGYAIFSLVVMCRADYADEFD